MDGNSYNGPVLHVVMTRVNGSTSEYEWHVTMRASDASGTRELGYRASGNLNDLNNLIFECGPHVHDECREDWTTMNDTDRPDIRERMRSLAFTARDKLKASGKDKFEHLIK
jgi:hypothetical protein